MESKARTSPAISFTMLIFLEMMAAPERPIVALQVERSAMPNIPAMQQLPAVPREGHNVMRVDDVDTYFYDILLRSVEMARIGLCLPRHYPGN